MKQWLKLLIVSTVGLSACAVEPIQLPKFETAARQDIEVTYPVALPLLCEWPWSAECLERLNKYEDVAEANTKIAQLNAEIVTDSDEAYDHILSAAKQQQEIAQIRQQMLEAERRDHFIDDLWHKALIVLLGLGYIL